MNAFLRGVALVFTWLAETVKQKQHEIMKRRQQKRTEELRELVRQEIKTRQMEHAVKKHDVEENPYESNID